MNGVHAPILGGGAPSSSSVAAAGADAGLNRYRLVSGLFLRLLGGIYLAAFASLSVQILGLAGEEGILPVRAYLEALRAESGGWAWLRVPTLFWLSAADWALQAAALAGCVLSVLLILGRWLRPVLVALWVLYLSLAHAGQIFMNFQWDYLLLEAGFLAIFLPGGAPVLVWLYKILLFRLRFLSGISKLLSGDPSWAGLAAVGYYFETQPLPHVGAWYAHQLPAPAHGALTFFTLVIEIVVPFMMFLPRTPRFIAAWLTLGMQAAILATSNHNFFNLLTMALCLFLFDDRALRRVLPGRLAARLEADVAPPGAGGRAQRWGLGVLAGALLAAAAVEAWYMVDRRPLPAALESAMRVWRGWHLAHPFHVFPTMKTERMEVVIEGSSDGEHWEPYEFRYRPDRVDEAPRFIVPHQPRVDWMMWFVPTGPLFLDWYAAFQRRLLDNAAPVTGLLARNPFPGEPPRYLRSSLWRYRFTTPQERAQSGHWWVREWIGPFWPLPGMQRPGS